MALAMVNAPFVIKLALLEPEVLPKRTALEALPKAPLEPDGAAAPTIKVPSLMVVVPPKVLAPDSTTEPAPDLVSAPAPEIIPVLNVAVPLASAVKVTALLSVMLPVKVALFAPVPPIVIVPLLPD